MAESKYNSAESVDVRTARSLAVTADLSIAPTLKRKADTAESLGASAAITARPPLETVPRRSRMPADSVAPTSSLDMPTKYIPPKLTVQFEESLVDDSEKDESVRKEVEPKLIKKKASLKQTKASDLKKKGKRGPPRKKLIVISRTPEMLGGEEEEEEPESSKKKPAKKTKKSAREKPKGKIKRKGAKPKKGVGLKGARPKGGGSKNRESGDSGESGDSDTKGKSVSVFRKRLIIIGVVVSIIVAILILTVLISVLAIRAPAAQPAASTLSFTSNASAMATNSSSTTAAISKSDIRAVATVTASTSTRKP